MVQSDSDQLETDRTEASKNAKMTEQGEKITAISTQVPVTDSIRESAEIHGHWNGEVQARLDALEASNHRLEISVCEISSRICRLESFVFKQKIITSDVCLDNSDSSVLCASPLIVNRDVPDASSGMFVEESVERKIGPESMHSVRMSQGIQEKFCNNFSGTEGDKGENGRVFPSTRENLFLVTTSKCFVFTNPSRVKNEGVVKKECQRKSAGSNILEVQPGREQPRAGRS